MKLSKGAFAAILLSLASCATNPAMETFPMRKMDRAFVAEGGVSSWSTIGSGSLSRRSDGSIKQVDPFPIPLYFSTPIFDKLDLAGVLIPSLFRYQIEHNESGYLGVVAGSGWGSTPFGFFYQPTVGLAKQWRQGDTATQASIGIKHTFFPDGGPTVWEADLALAQEFQWGPMFWIKPGVEFDLVHTNAYSKVSGAYTYYTTDGVKLDIPVSIQASFVPVKNWEFTAGYSLGYLGRTNGTWDQNYSLGVTLYY